MWTLLGVFTLIQVLICAETQRDTGNVFSGTVGDRVELSCNYADGYLHTPKYFCRYPCGYYDVLIKSEKINKVISEGRYSILSTTSSLSFSVTIKDLRLEDSGVYYCGVDKWGPDKLIKAVISVRKDNFTKQEQASSTMQSIHLSGIHDDFTTRERASSTMQSIHSSVMHEHPVYGGALGLLLCCVFAALLALYRKWSHTHSTSLKPPTPENQFSDPTPDQDEDCHDYEEMLAVYSLAGPAVEDDPSEVTYSVIQHVPPAKEDSSLYSVIAPH
ncbi:uncharacterized protein [Salminus brasiliensis]|uniref:uncharacterized protein n=1 Tax=Salminus brasiliensis TaxID=930266 RepID=UPI003B835B29